METSDQNPSAIARDLHSDALVIDGHNDTIVAHIRRGYRSLFEDADKDRYDAASAAFRLLAGEDHVGTIGVARGPELHPSETDVIQINFPKMIQGGVDVAFFAVDVTVALNNHVAYAMDGFGWLLDELESKPNEVKLVRSAEDIRKAKEAGTPAAIMAIEHADGVGGSLHILRALYEIGVRSIGLTHNRSSMAADGCGESRHGVGLTRFGVDLIREMNRLGILVDLAHASPSAFYHALEISEMPVIFSHGNSKELCDHQRNLDDKQLEALANAGGVIGISFVPDFIDPKKPTFERLLDHIDHISRIAGIDVVGIGSDFDGGGTLIHDATEYTKITLALDDRGYSEENIRKILGGNFMRVIEAGLGGAD